MQLYEYKVVPAPQKGQKGKGVRGAEARFAHALECLMNQMGADGWEYQRADMLPSTERSGLTGSTTEWRHVLVFKRPKPGQLDEFQPRLLTMQATSDRPSAAIIPMPDISDDANWDDVARPEDGVERVTPVDGFTEALLSRAERVKADSDPEEGTQEPEEDQPKDTIASDEIPETSCIT